MKGTEDLQPLPVENDLPLLPWESKRTRRRIPPRKLLENGMDALGQLRFADLFAALGHAQPQQKRDAYYRQAAEVAVQEWKDGRPENFFTAFACFGPRLLREPEVLDIIETWWFQKFIGKTKEERRTASEYLKRMGTEFSVQASGSKGLFLKKEERRAVYEQEKLFCQRFKKEEKIVSGKYRRKHEQNRELAKRLNRPEREITQLREESINRSPADWATERAAKILGVSLDTLKSTLFRSASPRKEGQ